MIAKEIITRKKQNTVDYKGYLIRETAVSIGRIFETEYIISDSGKAYQVVDPATGLILGTFSTIEKAQRAVDRHGERWRRL